MRDNNVGFYTVFKRSNLKVWWGNLSYFNQIFCVCHRYIFKNNLPATYSLDSIATFFPSMTMLTWIKLLGPEYDGIKIFRIVCYNLPVDTVQQPKRLVLQISLSMPAIIPYKVKVMFHSRECSWPAQHGQSLLSLATTVGGKDTDPVKNVNFYHYMTFHWSPFVRFLFQNRVKAKFMHSSDHTEHYRKQMFLVTRKKKKSEYSPTQSTFLSNILVILHKKRTAGFPQRKQLPRSIANFTITLCNLVLVKHSWSKNITWRMYGDTQGKNYSSYKIKFGTIIQCVMSSVSAAFNISCL